MIGHRTISHCDSNQMVALILSIEYAASTSAFILLTITVLLGPYVDGVSLTHELAGSHQHIWSFASDTWLFKINGTAPVLTLILTGHTINLLMLVMITSVILDQAIL